MKTYEIALKGYGRGLPAWLAYRVKAASAEEAVCKAKKQAAEHYIEFEWFEVQSIGEVQRPCILSHCQDTRSGRHRNEYVHWHKL